VKVVPLNGAIGAELLDVDLRDVTDELISQVRAALFDHLVLFVPGQDLTDDSQRVFAGTLGAPYVHPLARVRPNAEWRAEHIVDDAEHPPFQDEWHTDVTWDPEPPRFAVLRAVDLPERGGDTIWASTYAAYESLSPTLQNMVDGLSAFHDIGAAKAFVSKAGADVTARAAELVPGAEHPVVRTHPDTGRKHVYVNRGFTRRVVGLDPDESDTLLELLFRHCERPNFQIRHRWSPGDVVVWDELPTQHYATADHFPRRREMARITVKER
jgi:taurine dioxygenase